MIVAGEGWFDPRTLQPNCRYYQILVITYPKHYAGWTTRVCISTASSM